MSSQKTRPFELPAISRNASDLIIELKDLNERLQALEQEEDELAASELRSKLAPIATGLIEHKWMLHRDKIIRLMVACCLSQILRLYAPDPPFSGETLSRVFSLFVQQLRGLSELNGTYYAHYFGLLEGLATVKSIVLVWEVPEDEGRDLILLDLFKTSLALVHPKLGQSVRVYLLELLEAVIGESPSGSSLSDQTIQMLLESLQTSQNMTEFINELVQMCAQAIAPMLGRYFTDILISHASTPALDLVRQVHNQLSALNSTEALFQVTPQIVHELQVEQAEMRNIAIQTLAAIFTNAKHGKMFGGAWTAWLGRMNDRVQGVRGHWVAKAVEILPKLVDSQSQEELASALIDKLMDPEERIRERVLVCLDQSSNLESLPTSLIEAVAGRCLDLKEDVRVSALSLLSSLVSKLDISLDSASSGSSLEVQSRKAKWSFLSKSLLGLCLTDNQDARLLFEYFLEHSFLSSSLPNSPSGSMDLPVKTQALRWVWLWSCLDERGRVAFTVWIRAKSQFVKLTQAYLQLASTQSIQSRQMSTVLQYLADRFRSPVAAQSMLTALIDNEEMRQSLAVLVNPNVPLDTLRRTLQSVTRMHDPKIRSFLLQYMATRASWIGVSRELVTELLGLAQIDPSVPQILELLMTEMPSLAANHGTFLLEACILSDYGAAQLKSLYQFIKSSSDQASVLTGGFVSCLEELMDSSTCRHQVKMATRILLLLKPDSAASIVESAVTDTAHPDTATKLRAWQILSVLGQQKPSLFPPYLEELLLEYEVILSDVGDVGVASDVPDGLVKVSTGFWGHHLPVMPTPMLTAHEQTFAYEVSLAILKSLKQVNKDLLPSMLKNLLVILGTEGVNLAYLLTNSALMELLGNASEKTISKVTHLVAYHKTSPLVLLPILVEMNKEGLSRFKNASQQALQNWSRSGPANDEGEEEHLVDSGSIRLLEDLMIPLLVLLSRSIASEASIDARLGKCRSSLNLFFDLILTQENVSYLFALAVEVKRYHVPKFLKDQVSGRTLYLCSEVAQSILRQKATWMHVSLQSFPLPLRIIDTTLAPLEPHLASQNLTRSYLARANSKKEETKKRFGRKAVEIESVQASSASSPKRRNPGRNAKLPAGTLEAILSYDGSDIEMMSDEEEEENIEEDGSNTMVDVVPLKRKARLSNEPSEIILGT